MRATSNSLFYRRDGALMHGSIRRKLVMHGAAWGCSLSLDARKLVEMCLRGVSHLRS